MIIGCDVSHWEPNIDWKKVAAWRSPGGDRIRFAVLKCTEGISFFDPTYLPNVGGCRANEIDFCGYHYFHPDLDKDAQLTWFLQHRQVGQLPDGLDDEEENDELGVQVPPLKHTGRTLGWLTAYKRETGLVPWLYCNLNFIRNILLDKTGIGAVSDLWLAWPSGTVPAMGGYEQPSIIQYSWKGKVDGIPGDVDMNHFMGTEEQYQVVRTGAYVAPFPVPTMAEKVDRMWDWYIQQTGR